MSIPNADKQFERVEDFLAYLEALKFDAWRPSFITMHHSGDPNGALWDAWQQRKPPVSDKQWMANLASYYGKSRAQGGPADGPWQHGPHFFITKTHYCVLSPPTVRGTHAKSFNALSWGVEVVGDFDREAFSGVIHDRAIDGLAAMHVALGRSPDDFKLKVRGLHFHRDDPLTSKTCPGNHVQKAAVVDAVLNRMATMTGGESPDHPIIHVSTMKRMGRANIDKLNIRAGASAKAPIIGVLGLHDPVVIIGSAMNDTTKWLQMTNGWVAARYIDLQA